MKMHICILDGRKVKDKGMLHDILTASLRLPDWYGRNLDALYDCLTDIQEETEIRILHESAMEEHMGNYAKALAKVIKTATEENAHLRFLKIPDEGMDADETGCDGVRE